MTPTTLEEALRKIEGLRLDVRNERRYARDHFATKALAVLLAGNRDYDAVALESYRVADAMMRVRRSYQPPAHDEAA